MRERGGMHPLRKGPDMTGRRRRRTTAHDGTDRELRTIVAHIGPVPRRSVTVTTEQDAGDSPNARERRPPGSCLPIAPPRFIQIGRTRFAVLPYPCGSEVAWLAFVDDDRRTGVQGWAAFMLYALDGIMCETPECRLVDELDVLREFIGDNPPREAGAPTVLHIGECLPELPGEWNAYRGRARSWRWHDRL